MERIVITINESTEVVLSGAVIEVLFHKERIASYHMVYKLDDYKLDTLIEMAESAERIYRMNHNAPKPESSQ